MVSEKTLLTSPKYKFQHLKVDVIEKDEKDKVMAFKASFVTKKLPSEFMSKGHIEVNKTLWDEGSSKRPKGYWVLNTVEEGDIMTTYLVSDEWLELPRDLRKQKQVEWGLN